MAPPTLRTPRACRNLERLPAADHWRCCGLHGFVWEPAVQRRDLRAGHRQHRRGVRPCHLCLVERIQRPGQRARLLRPAAAAAAAAAAAGANPAGHYPRYSRDGQTKGGNLLHACSRTSHANWLQQRHARTAVQPRMHAHAAHVRAGMWAMRGLHGTLPAAQTPAAHALEFRMS